MSIALRTGDVTVEVTDLKINTPAGPLTLTRTYRQDKVLVANQAWLGRGWSHNHHIRLKAIGNPVEELHVLTAGHGLLRFTKSGTDAFEAVAGATATMTYDSSNDEYSMTAQDQSVYLFDLDPDTSLGAGDFTYRLISRTWENGDMWSYTYDDTGMSPTYRLTTVEDSRYTIDGSTHRSLSFTYNGNGLLDRVTDHTGRYVEFKTYVADQEPDGSGGVQNGSSYVLTEVQDVRGEGWQYDYYGQSAGETDEYLLNHLIQRIAPPADLSGDGTDEDELTLEQLDFGLPTNEIVNGNMETTLGWSTVGSPTSAGQSSAEADNGDHAWHVNADAAGEGIESNSWDMNANRTYIASARVKVLSGTVKMAVSGGASGFEVDSTTTDEWETLTAVYRTSSATTGHQLQFLSKDNPAEFYVDSVQVTQDFIANRNMEASGDWSVVNSATHNQYPQDQYIKSGSASRHVDGLAAGDGIRSDTTWNMSNGKTYDITAQVYVVSGTVKMTVNGTTQLDDISSGSGSWEPLSASYPATATTTGHYVQFLADGGPAEFYLDDVTITEDTTTELITDGDMEVDYGWSAVAGGVQALYPRTMLEGDYSWEVIADGAGKGIQSNNWDMVADHAYLAAAWVYVVSGTVKLSVSGVGGFEAVSTATGRWERLVAVHVPSSGSSNHTLQLLAEGGAAEFYVDEAAVQVAPLITRTLGIDPSTWGEDLTETMVTEFIMDPTHHRRTHTHERLLGSDGSTYYTTLHQFDNGVLTRSQNPLGQGGQRQQTNRYRDALRQDANGNASWLSWNQDLLDNGDMEEDAVWTKVGTFTNDPARVDAQGTNQVHSGHYAWFVDDADAEEGIQSSSFALRQDKSYYIEAQVYVETGTAVKLELWDGSSQLASLASGGTTDEWVQLRAWYTPTADEDTAYLRILADTGGATFYVDAVKVQQENGDQVTRVVDAAGNATEFSYDSQERLLFSIDAEGRKTRYKYNDTVNPQQPTEIIVLDTDGTVLQWQYFERSYDGNDLLLSAKDKVLNPADYATYENTPGSATPLRETERSYYTNGNGAGLLKRVTQNDRSTTYLYDALGRMVQTNQSTTVGSCTRSRTVYDAADNVVASICNFDFDPSGTPSANSEVTDHEAEYAFDEDPTTYWQASSVSGEWLEFDFGASNAPTLTQLHLTARDTAADVDEMPKDFDIQAYNGSTWDTLSSVTGETGWQVGETRTFSFTNSTAYQRWRILVSAVDGGSQVSLAEMRLRSLPTDAASAEALYDDNLPDKNRVTTYAYDARGLQVETKLNAGSSTDERINLTAYDGLGRVVRTISNYDAAGAPTHPYTAARSGFSHGTDGSQNRVSDTLFNARGLAWQTVDTRDRVTLYGYDAASRQVRVVQNASNPSYDAASDPDLSGYSASGQSGEDLITASVYDAAGNLIQQTDVLGFDDFTVYDSLNRVVKTVRRAKDGARIDLNPGDTGYDAANDPRAATYAPIPDPDRDLITLTEYDSLGRVIRSRDEIGNWTLFGYDGLGRQVRTIASASQPFYDIAGDPDLSDYVASSETDEDILSDTVYATGGQVQYTADVNGLETWFAYDGSGRQVKTAVNYMGDPGDLIEWVWESGVWKDDEGGNTISHGAGNDENIVSQTVYDTEGRVESTRDVLGRVTRQVYDEQGRRTLTIRNYIDNSVDPIYWFWDDTNNQWEYDDGMSSSGVISHGTDGDENIIAQTIYDSQGRVDMTRDQRGNLTKTVLDANGRVDKTIRNYVANSQDPLNWEWITTQWEDGNNTGIEHGTAKDQNLISQTTYDSEGRVDTVRDSAGRLTKFVYDAVGRREKVIRNYVANSQDPLNWEWVTTQWEDGLGNGINHGSNNDQNLISQTISSPTGQVAATRDARGTKTSFVYDAAGRRVQVTAAADTPLATMHYTVYDKAGRVHRTIANCTYNPQEDDAPHAKDNNGNWLYDPAAHGPLNDRDLITERVLDKRGRVIQRIDPAGASYQTAYAKDGRVVTSTDPENVEQRSVYDQLRRLTRVVANYQAIGVDPALWVWATSPGEWQDGSTNAIDHDPDSDGNADTNIIAEVTLDVVGRQLTLRDPRGNLTTYTYDQLNRRLSMQDALNNTWSTAYIDTAVDLDSGQSRIEHTNPLAHVVQRDFDRAGRLQAINYLSESPKLTPDVSFGYDVLGNRTLMSEDAGSLVRESYFTYDQAARLVTVDLDIDGDTTIDETLNYEYDLAGQRTKLILPGGTDAITYQYDAKGRLVAITDWDLGASQFLYDNADRLMLEERTDDLATRYRHDTGGRLRALTHLDAHDVLAQFTFEVDERGNRTLSREALLQPGTSQTTIASDDDAIAYDGTWTVNGSFMETTQVGAELAVAVMGDAIELTLGNGTDHGICDIYVNGVFWGSRDTYSASASEETLTIELDTIGPHVLRIRNTGDEHLDSTGHKLRFKQGVLPVEYDLHTIQYTYDAMARLMNAHYFAGENLNATAFRKHDFTYDESANRLNHKINLIGQSEVEYAYGYNVINEIISETIDGGTPQSFTYDAAGRLTDDGTLSYTWDRADRLLETDDGVTTVAYEYNGLGHRVKQDTTDYLLDTVQGLPRVIADKTGSTVNRYVLSDHGLLRHQKPDSSWVHPLKDGLGSVRHIVDASLDPLYSVNHTPYGELWNAQGTSPMSFGFTGEWQDPNDLLFLRARYYNPAQAAFLSLDPLEGGLGNVRGVNRYAYVNGNPANLVDPSGLTGCFPSSCPPGAKRTFHYVGARAALRANRVALNGFSGVNLDVNTEFNSANFMSFALHAGGFPMTTSSDTGGNICATRAAQGSGWCAAQDPSSGIISGNPIWRNHNNTVVDPTSGVVEPIDGLIGYLRGVSDVVGNGIAGLGSVPIIIGINEIFPKNGDPSNLENYTNPYIQFQTRHYFVPDIGTRISSVMSRLGTLGVGDYIYTPTSDDESGGGSHGFLIVGKGPALMCNSPSLLRSRAIGDSVLGGTFSPGATSIDDILKDPNLDASVRTTPPTETLGINVDLAPGTDVFYVADVSDVPQALDNAPGRFGSQRGTARPFYCSKFQDNDLGGSTFSHLYWYFYPVPKSITVDCSRLYTPDPLEHTRSSLYL